VAICSQCGSPLKPGAKFCAVCGTRNLAGAGPLPLLPGALPALPVPASAPPAAAALLVNANGQQQVAVTDQMNIGRDPACDLWVDVDDVSRRHATVVAQASGWAVKDLGSRNGTFVNDQPVVTVTAIYHKDHVRFGATADYALYDPAHLRPQGAGAALAPTTTITPVAVTQSALTPSKTGKTIPPRHAWPKAPDAEGYILSLRGPIAVERGDKMGKAFLAVGLGLINPVLAFIPFAVGKNQVLVTLMRLDDLDKGRQVAVTLVGDARSIVDEGDLIAVWGRVEQGTVLAVHIYNYTTDAMSQVIA
jgi:hypothetical protein